MGQKHEYAKIKQNVMLLKVERNVSSIGVKIYTGSKFYELKLDQKD